ncbi:hypothetical protein [Legionella quateirensis]|nr:hypothetical protein [Legionella quateirensis]
MYLSMEINGISQYGLNEQDYLYSEIMVVNTAVTLYNLKQSS